MSKLAAMLAAAKLILYVGETVYAFGKEKFKKYRNQKHFH